MDAGITGSYVEFLEKHLEGDYRCFRRRKYAFSRLSNRIICYLFGVFCPFASSCLTLLRNNRIGDMFKKAVELFPSCAPLLRAFASYCDNGKRTPTRHARAQRYPTTPLPIPPHSLHPSARGFRPSTRVSRPRRRSSVRLIRLRDVPT
jgi:hypothetical protein